MATVESVQNIDIAAEFDAGIAEHASAYLLPFDGPTYSEVVESRRRWCLGEEVTPTALNIGTITLSGAFKEALETAPILEDNFSMLYLGNATRGLRGDAAFEGTNGIWFIHRLVGLVAKLDAQRRGMHKPNVDGIGTYGGIHTVNTSTTHEHVDDGISEETVLRYVATVLGDPTILYRRQLSMRDITISGDNEVKSPSKPSQMLAYPGGRLVAVTMFELHTPHKRPLSNQQVRLYTSVDAI